MVQVTTEDKITPILREALLNYEAGMPSLLTPEQIVALWMGTPEGPKQVWSFVFEKGFSNVPNVGIVVGELNMPMLNTHFHILLAARTTKEAELILLRTKYPELAR